MAESTAALPAICVLSWMVPIPIMVLRPLGFRGRVSIVGGFIARIMLHILGSDLIRSKIISFSVGGRHFYLNTRLGYSQA